MTIVLQAKQRLKAEQSSTDESNADRSAKQQIDRQIDNKKEQVHHLKQTMPSRQNRMKVDPDQKNRTEKDILRTREQESDLRLKKSKIGD